MMLVWSNRRIVLPHPIVTDGTVWSNLDAFAVRLSMKPLASVDPSVGPVAHAVTMIPALGPVSGVFAAVLEDVLSFTAPQPVLELPFVLGAIGPGVLSLALPLIHAKVAGIDSAILPLVHSISVPLIFVVLPVKDVAVRKDGGALAVPVTPLPFAGVHPAIVVAHGPVSMRKRFGRQDGAFVFSLISVWVDNPLLGRVFDGWSRIARVAAACRDLRARLDGRRRVNQRGRRRGLAGGGPVHWQHAILMAPRAVLARKGRLTRFHHSWAIAPQ
mmetsp:Transcript_2171/g.5492  ORF Transcript_2171/g.5492 Transcript_2171/m.5492 type:complete len:272 (-) Transcript_2171:2751-3566(-)